MQAAVDTFHPLNRRKAATELQYTPIWTTFEVKDKSVRVSNTSLCTFNFIYSLLWIKCLGTAPASMLLYTNLQYINTVFMPIANISQAGYFTSDRLVSCILCSTRSPYLYAYDSRNDRGWKSYFTIHKYLIILFLLSTTHETCFCVLNVIPVLIFQNFTSNICPLFNNA